MCFSCTPSPLQGSMPVVQIRVRDLFLQWFDKWETFESSEFGNTNSVKCSYLLKSSLSFPIGHHKLVFSTSYANFDIQTVIGVTVHRPSPLKRFTFLRHIPSLWQLDSFSQQLNSTDADIFTLVCPEPLSLEEEQVLRQQEYDAFNQVLIHRVVTLNHVWSTDLNYLESAGAETLVIPCSEAHFFEGRLCFAETIGPIAYAPRCTPDQAELILFALAQRYLSASPSFIVFLPEPRVMLLANIFHSNYLRPSFRTFLAPFTYFHVRYAMRRSAEAEFASATSLDHRHADGTQEQDGRGWGSASSGMSAAFRWLRR